MPVNMAMNGSSDRYARRYRQPPPTTHKITTPHKPSESTRESPDWGDDSWRPNNLAANWSIPDRSNSWQARRSSQNDDYASRGKSKRPDLADHSIRKPQNDDYACSGKSKRGDLTGDESRIYSQNDDYASGGKSQRGDYSGRATQNDDNANSGKSKRGNTNQRHNDSSLFSRYNNKHSYSAVNELKKLEFCPSYDEMDHRYGLYECFLDGTLPINTPDKLLLVSQDAKSMNAKNSSALKVYTQILRHRDIRFAKKNEK